MIFFCVKVLLSAGFPINITDDQGQTALHTAVLLGHEGAVITLLEAGASKSLSKDPIFFLFFFFSLI